MTYRLLLGLLLFMGIVGPATAQEQSQEERARKRWNSVFTADQPRFNTEPNEFLVEIVQGLKPGTALDLGMGQGRNALYLAQQGWKVTGVDVADEGIRIAKENAKKMGVEIDALLQSADDFDFGTNKWDLIAIIYFGARGFEEKIRDGLKPGGVVVVEGFHKDATRNARIGAGVVWETNELLRLFQDAGLRVIHYEDTMGTADYGKQHMRLVRIAAQK